MDVKCAIVFSLENIDFEPVAKPNRALIAERISWWNIAIYYAIACGLSWAIWAPVDNIWIRELHTFSVWSHMPRGLCKNLQAGLSL
jgi:hypothetical protein